MRIVSYKLVVDSGFAPNPFGSTLTLATCKPDIRKNRKVGDWIAGFTSKGLSGDVVGSERLIYLMRVGEKLRLRDYFNDSRFQEKIPVLGTNDRIAAVGDNIYSPLISNAEFPDDFRQLTNQNHFDCDIQRDVNGKYVLIADEFYYFGRSALQLPDEIRPSVPLGQTRFGQLTQSPRAERLVDYIRKGFSMGRIGNPHHWYEESDEICPETIRCKSGQFVTRLPKVPCAASSCSAPKPIAIDPQIRHKRSRGPANHC